MCKTCTNLTQPNLETVYSIHLELWAFVVKVRDIENNGQNVWVKVPFSRIAAIFARSPLPPRCNVGRLVGKPFLTNKIALGDGEEGRIWPKERLFPCEKLIDRRGSAFCKLVQHNFGQDCLNVEIKHKSACNFQIIQRMDVKFGMVNVRDLLLVFHPNVAI